MSLKRFLEIHDFDFDRLAVSRMGGGLTEKELEISPLEFLKLAEDDYQKGGLSSQINSITNSKRAIVCQMDQTLMSFGLQPLKWNIPKKIEHLKKLGLLTPAILRKVSFTRNLLEHEYVRPTKDETETALDIASLFVLGNSSTLKSFVSEFEFGHDKHWCSKTNSYLKYLYLSIDHDSNDIVTIKICAYNTIRNQRASNNSTSLKYSTIYPEVLNKLGEYIADQLDPLFYPLIKMANAFSVGYRIDDAIAELNQAFIDS